MITNSYHNSLVKKIFDAIVSLFCLIITFPLVVVISLAIETTSKGSIFFLQKRVGKDGKLFKLIKFRTMIINAEKIKNNYKHLNEADGPVFKITNDPRFTKIGKILSRSGLDELPQFINVLKGDMSIVGPRPLPVYEARRLNKKQKIRELVKPGITSNWVVNGSHKLTFGEWMRLDEDYVNNASLMIDLKIILGTCGIIFRSILNL